MHYPLPLTFQSEPSAASLQRTISRLQGEVARFKSMAAGLQQGSTGGMSAAFSRLQQENDALRAQNAHLRSSLSSCQASQRELQSAATAAETGRGKAEEALDRLKGASRGEVKRLRAEVTALKEQLVHVHHAAEANAAAAGSAEAEAAEELKQTNTKLRARIRDLTRQMALHGIKPRTSGSGVGRRGTPTRGVSGSRARGGGRQAGRAGSRGSVAGAAYKARTPSPAGSRGRGRSTKYSRPWAAGPSPGRRSEAGSVASSVGSRASSTGSRRSVRSSGSAASGGLKRRHSSGKYGYDPVAYAKARREKIEAAKAKRRGTPTRRTRPGSVGQRTPGGRSVASGTSKGRSSQAAPRRDSSRRQTTPKRGALPAYMRSPGGRSVGSAGSYGSVGSAFSTGSRRSGAGRQRTWDRPWRTSPKSSSKAPTKSARGRAQEPKKQSPRRPKTGPGRQSQPHPVHGTSSSPHEQQVPSQGQAEPQPHAAAMAAPHAHAHSSSFMAPEHSHAHTFVAGVSAPRQAWPAPQAAPRSPGLGRSLQHPPSVPVSGRADEVDEEGMSASGAALGMSTGRSRGLAHKQGQSRPSSSGGFISPPAQATGTMHVLSTGYAPGTAAVQGHPGGAASVSASQGLSHQHGSVDSQAEISAIDQRLQALQDFLKATKEGRSVPAPVAGAQ